MSEVFAKEEEDQRLQLRGGGITRRANHKEAALLPPRLKAGPGKDSPGLVMGRVWQ